MSTPRFKSVHLLAAALLAGGAGAAFGLFSNKSPDAIAALPPTPAPQGQPAMPGEPGSINHGGGMNTPGNLPPGHPNVGGGAPAPGGAPAAAAPANVIEGEVLEVLNVPGYTYARIGAKGTDGTWAAFPTSKLAVGDKAKVNAEMMMKDFPSKALNKTFPSIWFGNLDDGKAPPAGAAAMNEGMPPAPAGSAPIDAKAERAPGGKTVAEIIAERTQLAGKSVKLRAVVVKVNAGILGKTYLHVRDGSGDAKTANNDLSVTMQDTPKVGDTIMIEGVVGLDRDIGGGYKFPTIIEEAKIVTN